MTNITELREAIHDYSCVKHSPIAHLRDAAAELLKLYELHGDGIKGLIEGTHDICAKDNVVQGPEISVHNAAKEPR